MLAPPSTPVSSAPSARSTPAVAGHDAEVLFPDSPLVERYLTWLRVERGLLEGTVRAYARELCALATVVGQPEDVDAESLRSYIHERGGAPATVARRLAALKSFYSYLVRTGVRIDDPTEALSRPKVRRGLPRPIEDADLVLSKLDPQTRQIAVFLRETGLRISEACSVSVTVPVPDVLCIRGKGDRERLVLLSSDARVALEELGGRMPVGTRTIQRRFRQAGFTPHRLRHTFGTELAASGADLGEIQELLGHASPATSRVYARYDLGRLRAAHERRRAWATATSTTS